MDLAAKLKALQQTIEEKRALRDRLEGQLQTLKRQWEELVEEMKTLGVTPETIEDEMERLQTEAKTLLSEAESLLSREVTPHELPGDYQDPFGP
ncbi:MAG: hypothetical protein KM310_00340 [Clostridiales bacterium]|nr:hypothetical protein [Clostridiales bacterium]